MPLFSRARKSKPEPETVAVTIPGRHLDSRMRPNRDLSDLLDALVGELEGMHTGDFDIMERAQDSTILFFSGNDGQQLYHGIRPVLASFAFCHGATATVCCRDGKTQEYRIEYNAYA